VEGVLTDTETMPGKTLALKTGDSVTEQPNLKYACWVARDQALLRFLLSSLTRDVLMGVTTTTTFAAVWSALDGMFISPTRACTVNIRIALATTKKGTTIMSEYFSKMKTYADEMVSSGQPLGDEVFVAYVLTGPDEE
jgi:hypothetical protein